MVLSRELALRPAMSCSCRHLLECWRLRFRIADSHHSALFSILTCLPHGEEVYVVQCSM